MKSIEHAHPLHVAIGDLFEKFISPDCRVIRDEASGGNQRIPLFCARARQL